MVIWVWELNCWNCRYIKWSEETFPSGGAHSEILTLLEKCTTHFKDNPKYKNDERYLDVWLKYVSFRLEEFTLISLLSFLCFSCRCDFQVQCCMKWILMWCWMDRLTSVMIRRTFSRFWNRIELEFLLQNFILPGLRIWKPSSSTSQSNQTNKTNKNKKQLQVFECCDWCEMVLCRGNTERADKVYDLGIGRNAQPVDKLKKRQRAFHVNTFTCLYAFHFTSIFQFVC